MDDLDDLEIQLRRVELQGRIQKKQLELVTVAAWEDKMQRQNYQSADKSQQETDKHDIHR